MSSIIHKPLAGAQLVRLTPLVTKLNDPLIQQWITLLEKSWGCDDGYPFHPSTEIPRIGDGGFAIGFVSSKGVLLAAQAVNRYANTMNWDGTDFWWSLVTTRPEFQRMCLARALYCECMSFVGENDGRRLLVPFEKHTLVPFLHKRGWIEAPERFMPNEGNDISLIWELSRSKLKDYLSGIYANDDCNAYKKYAA